MRNFLFILLMLTLAMLACSKEGFITSSEASVSVSSDTLHFDTVFTTVGSATRLVKIFNHNDQKLRFSRIRLAGGSNSFFRTNIDGVATANAENIEVDANDSLYVYVSVRIDPSQGNIPFVVEDSIEIQFNGNSRWVQLQAWGQDATFLRSHVIQGSETWNKNKPYVVLGGLYIPPSSELRIEQGTRIYVHADSPIIVDGTIVATGDSSAQDRVRFTGDRLDEPYRNFPASWPGIYIRNASHGNLLRYTDILNAYQGIVCEGGSTSPGPKLTLQQVVIDNAYDAGILAIHSSITAENTLISNCGKGVILAKGGEYHFEHVTAAAVSNNYILHKEPVLFISNYMREGNSVVSGELRASFVNSIFWGSGGAVDNEVQVAREGQDHFELSFSHCLWKVEEEPTHGSFDNMLNADPLFEESLSHQPPSFFLQTSSPAISAGRPTQLAFDLRGRLRNTSTPDLGAFHRND